MIETQDDALGFATELAERDEALREFNEMEKRKKSARQLSLNIPAARNRKKGKNFLAFKRLGEYLRRTK
jgi:hypothetical protein